MKSHMKIFWFITFQRKFWLAQNHCILDTIKNNDWLEFIIELNV